MLSLIIEIDSKILIFLSGFIGALRYPKNSES